MHGGNKAGWEGRGIGREEGLFLVDSLYSYNRDCNWETVTEALQYAGNTDIAILSRR